MIRCLRITVQCFFAVYKSGNFPRKRRIILTNKNGMRAKIPEPEHINVTIRIEDYRAREAAAQQNSSRISRFKRREGMKEQEFDKRHCFFL